MKEELEPVFSKLNPFMTLVVTLDRQGQIVSFNKVCEQTTGYSFNEVRGRYIWDLFLSPEQVESFKAVYENLVAGSCSEYNYQNDWMTKDGTCRRIVWSSTALLSNEGAVEYIIGTGIDVTKGKPWSKEFNQQDQRTQLIAKISLKIRQSLQLEEILQTTVTEVRNLLEVDRVLIYRLWSDGTGSGVTEAVVPGWPTILGQTFDEEVFPQKCKKLYASGRVRAIKDVGTADIPPCLVEFLQQFGVTAIIVVPILLKEELWGLLIVHQCASSRQWSSFEIELLQQLADQVSIALAQSQHQEHLEELVAQRTAKLTNTNKQLQQEIIAHKRTEKARRESEQFLRSIYDGVEEAIFVLNVLEDVEFRYVGLNPAYERLTGIRLDDLRGKTPEQVLPLAEATAVRQYYTNCVQAGTKISYEECRTFQGADTWWLTTLTPLRDAHSRIYRLIGTSTNITERKLAEEVLYRREQELKTLLENSPDIIARFDRELRHVYVNPAIEQVSGISHQAFIGKTNRELGMPESLVCDWCEAIQHVFSTAQKGLIEFDFPTPTGVRSYQSHLVPEYATDGSVEFVLGVSREITERKRGEEVLRQWAFREQALNQVVQAIRNSLDLETIFATAVEEIGKLLQVDRVVIVQYFPEQKHWLNVADYRASPNLPVALGLEIPDEGNEIAARLKQKQVVLIDKAETFEDEINRKLSQTFPGAWLLVPLHVGSEVWGSLSFVVENRPYPWQNSEVELSLAVAQQLAIAIQQAQLLHQSRTATEKATEQATQLANEITERKRTEETLRCLYKISAARKLSLDQHLQGLLALGCRRFGLEMGALGRVENHLYEVVAAQVPLNSSCQLTKGSSWDLDQSYCNETLGTKKPIAFESAITSRWCNHPAYLSSRVEAYIGMPVVVAGKIYGTLSFFSLKERDRRFTDSDKELLKLMAQWVGAKLERQQAEEELRQSEARFRELAQREALLNQLSRQIRRSLDLNTILTTAVDEIRNLLQIDRCFFLWYRPNAVYPYWEVTQEAKASIFPSLIGHCIPVTTFGPLTARVFNKEITRVDSARTLTDPVERKFFFSIGYTALLALPIHTTSGEIGVVSCGHSSGSRPWRDSEVELLQAVADQIAIAIDQAQLLHQSRTAAVIAQEQATKLEKTLNELQHTQAQLVQSEKMSSLGQLVAGIAHEINNPISFIYGNLTYVNEYTKGLIYLVQLYQESYPQPTVAIQGLAEEIDLDFIREDLPKIVSSMSMGAERISQIVLSLRNFSRIDEAEMKRVDIHEGLDNTLLILAHRLKAKQPDTQDIQIIKNYGNLPKVQCYPGQLNQVFMNILSNALEALDEYNQAHLPEYIKKRSGTIWICTEVLVSSNQVVILIGDNGPGMTHEVCHRLFEPFFTTKPIGSGTGLGMSISYQIVVEKHRGQVECISAPGYGAAFLIYVPIHQPNRLPSQESGGT